MKRRTFVQALALPLLGPLGTAARARGRRLERIGLQLYTVRDLMQSDVARTLERVAAIGYREVEFAGYFGATPERIRRLLDSLGLTSPSTHLALAALEHQLGRTLDLAATIGHRYLVVPSLDQRDRRSLDDYRRVAEALNRAGEGARARGLRVAYHNHDFELRRLEGALPYEMLLEWTDPALVFFEMGTSTGSPGAGPIPSRTSGGTPAASISATSRTWTRRAPWPTWAPAGSTSGGSCSAGSRPGSATST